MWISRKKFMALEKRIADLEGQVQDQQTDLLVTKEVFSKIGLNNWSSLRKIFSEKQS